MSDDRLEVPDEALIALGRLTAEVAHELRNFMTAILVGSEHLAQHRDTEVAKTGQRIHDNATRCRSYVNQLLTHLDTPGLDLQTIDLAAVIADYLEKRDTAGTIQVVQSQTGPAFVCGHPSRLISILENLIRNAEEAVLPSSCKIVCSIACEENSVVVTVQDNGPGISSSMKPRLFGDFQTEGKDKGPGLGLALSRRIAEEHGGTLELVDSDQRGAAFQLTLPLAVHEEPQAQETTGNESQLPTLEILCIDDDQSTLDTYEMILKLDGHKVTPALTGKDGLDHLRKRHFDIILCDLKLPDMSGKDFHHHLLQGSHRGAEKLIFATGDLMNDSSRIFLAQAGCPYLIKPFEIDELRVAIRVALQSSRR